MDHEVGFTDMRIFIAAFAPSRRTATSSSSPRLSTLAPAFVPTMPPRPRDVTLALVSARVPPRPVCLPRFCG